MCVHEQVGNGAGGYIDLHRLVRAHERLPSRPSFPSMKRVGGSLLDWSRKC
jgi:hypothetical protein